ncbi:hypothetical protein K1T71_003158 [Dendrolimus kikuchii]|uniref:Uncharacterized protein n=1 Tax=Dendrolimus kikuchii TaxID=765133 RepID=A0ACC1DAT7_9NEOP|nr:hypothetical protein K1T71_003158 [Dendrolimus kikuchii]
MSLPESIKFNTYLAYKPTENFESHRKLKSEDFHWSQRHAKTLVSICIEKLAENWMGFPKLEELVPKDREHFLRVLNTEVPLHILVENIKSDIFWKRCYNTKWSDQPLTPDGKKWINIFMEKHFADILENMNPRLYDPEKVTDLVKLCGSYIQSLSIRSLVPSDIPLQRITSPEMVDLVTSQSHNDKQTLFKNSEIVSRDHISLHAALGSLTNLVELHITYQQKFTGVEYRKDQYQFTNNDAKNLSRGLEKCGQLKVLRITRTAMNCQRLKYILRGLSESQKIETLDFSHCKIGDEGISALAKFVVKHENLSRGLEKCGQLKVLRLKYILRGLSESQKIETLDFSHCKIGDEGISALAKLNISGCGIKPGPLLRSPVGVWSATSAENPPTCGELLARAIGLVKTPLRFLDLSVNDIGSPSDYTLSNAICLSYIVDLNLKRSGMGSKFIAVAEAAAAAQRLRREAEKGIRFRRSAGRVLQARRVVKGMNIDADPVLLAQQLSARPSIVSVTSEEGIFTLQTQPLPSDFGFVPVLKSPLPSSRTSSITGPPTSRRSSHHMILEPVLEVRRTTLIRRGSDGSLLQPRSSDYNNLQRHIKIFIS